MDAIAADWIFLDGHILTLDPRRPRATSLAVGDGRIAAVGSRADLRAWRDRKTRVVVLKGATVTLEELPSLACRLTMVGGRVVHDGL